MGHGAARIDPQRLESIFAAINRFGYRGKAGGYDRIGFSDDDMAVRHWLRGRMTDEGLDAAIDAAGNVSGRSGPGDRPSIMLGSHLDTVPQGGAFDGALGVAVALECALAIRDAGLELAHPIEIVATAEEEGRFGGMLGSQALTGQVDPAWLQAARDADGVRLWDAMTRQGLDPGAVGQAARLPGSVKAFLELHVEQGPVLERTGIAIGIADCVSGVINLGVSLHGEANHSGTTPMDMRADAFAGLAEIASSIPAIIGKSGSDQSRITIGKVELSPNVAHTIAGSADFTVIVRDTDPAIMDGLIDVLESRIEAVAAAHGLKFDIEQRSRLEPVTLDAGIVSLLRKVAASQGVEALVMPSGAGHDAQTMQSLCPSGLIFVPSMGGISHSPQEWTDWEAILQGARLMLAVAVELAGGSNPPASP